MDCHAQWCVLIPSRVYVCFKSMNCVLNEGTQQETLKYLATWPVLRQPPVRRLFWSVLQSALIPAWFQNPIESQVSPSINMKQPCCGSMRHAGWFRYRHTHKSERGACAQVPTNQFPSSSLACVSQHVKCVGNVPTCRRRQCRCLNTEMQAVGLAADWVAPAASHRGTERDRDLADDAAGGDGRKENCMP